MDSMRPRLLTAAIGIPAAIIVLIFGEIIPLLLHIIIGVFCVIMIMEYLAAKKLHKNMKIFLPCAAYAFLQPILIEFFDFKQLSILNQLTDSKQFNLSMFAPYVFVLIMFMIMIFFHNDISYSDAVFAVFGTIVIVFGMSSILLVPDIYDDYYILFFIISLGIPWIADGGAYFAGVFLGKHKLCPEISPKKTVEGFAGGIAAGVISSLFIAVIFNMDIISTRAKLNIPLMLLLGAIVSIVSVIGDLSFSLIKRSCDIKDFGSFFPGHGGVLDRFDSVIFTAPIVYFMVRFLPLFTIQKGAILLW